MARLVDRSAEDHVEICKPEDAIGGLAAIDALDILDDLEEKRLIRPSTSRAHPDIDEHIPSWPPF